MERRSAEFARLMAEVARCVDPILGTDRDGATVVAMLGDLIRTARRARDKLVGLEAKRGAYGPIASRVEPR